MTTPRRTPAWPPPARPYVIAIGILAAIAVVSYGAFKQSIPFVSGYRVEATFETASGLRKGSPVRVAGIDVGKVIAIEAGPGHTSVVTMKIDADGRPVHVDATARIRPRVFLEGGYLVELEPGSPSAPVLRDDGSIPLSQTAAPVQFHDLLTVFDTSAREDVATTLDTFARGLDDGGAQGLRRVAPQLAPLLRDTAWIAEAAVGTGEDDLEVLIDSANRITTALDDDPGRLGSMVDHLATVAEAIRSRDGELAATLRQLDGVVAEIPGAARALDAALPAAERAAGQVTPALEVAPAALGEVLDVTRKLGRLVEPGRRERTLTGLTTAFVDLPGVVGRLAAVFPSARPLAGCLSSHVVPALSAVVPDGELTTGRPAWQDFAHALVGLSSVSQNFDGNGHSLRYQFGIGRESLSTETLPGFGELLATAPPTLRSRPLPRADRRPPPFRDDQPCVDQPAVDLAAQDGPAGLQAAPRGAKRTSVSIEALQPLLRPNRLRKLLEAAR
jgi:phospholipid/cholesterol/gamma-HCH transport system substrate-binding protein